MTKKKKSKGKKPSSSSQKEKEREKEESVPVEQKVSEEVSKELKREEKRGEEKVEAAMSEENKIVNEEEEKEKRVDDDAAKDNVFDCVPLPGDNNDHTEELKAMPAGVKEEEVAENMERCDDNIEQTTNGEKVVKKESSSEEFETNSVKAGEANTSSGMFRQRWGVLPDDSSSSSDDSEEDEKENDGEAAIDEPQMTSRFQPSKCNIEQSDSDSDSDSGSDSDSDSDSDDLISPYSSFKLSSSEVNEASESAESPNTTVRETADESFKGHQDKSSVPSEDKAYLTEKIANVKNDLENRMIAARKAAEEEARKEKLRREASASKRWSYQEKGKQGSSEASDEKKEAENDDALSKPKEEPSDKSVSGETKMDTNCGNNIAATASWKTNLQSDSESDSSDDEEIIPKKFGVK